MNQLPHRPCESLCPELPTLAAFLRGDLIEPVLVSIADHLETCPLCETRVTSLPNQNVEIDDRIRACFLLNDATADLEDGAATATGIWNQEFELSITDPATQQKFGTYHLEEVIGRGGMGIVYRATQPPLARLLAIKVVRSDIGPDFDSLSRFELEAKAIARLKHPNIVRLYDYGTEDHRPYFAMEYVEHSLSRRLATTLPDFGQAARWVRDVALAIEYAHSLGIVHRDLKPSNILLTETGEVKVSDFGLAKLLDSDTETLTNTNAIVGTPEYMPPEQAMPGSTITPASDIYAIGAVLYECLTGKPPFRGKTKLQTLDLVRKAEVPRPSKSRHGIPANLEAICLKCLEKAPGKRYPTAQAVADDLQRVLAGLRPLHTPRIRHRVARYLRKRLTVLCGIGILAIGAATIHSRDPDRPVRLAMSELAAGRPVTLIGENGWPTWHRIAVGKNTAQTSLSRDDRVFEAHAVEQGYIELLPTAPENGYILRAEIRHTRHAFSSLAGIYVGSRNLGARNQAWMQYITLVYNDIVSPQEIRPKPVLYGNLPPDMNRAILMMSLAYLNPEGRIDFPFTTECTEGHLFRPSGGSTNAVWRKFKITVEKDKITTVMDGSEAIIATNESLQKEFVKFERVKNLPRMPALVADIPSGIETSGGVGCYVRSGIAQFRNITIEPLPAAD